MSYKQHIKRSVQGLEPYTVKSSAFSPDLIKLNQNENPFDLPEEIKRELFETFVRMPWNRYPDVFPGELTDALAAFCSVSAGRIIAANGSNELMYTILTAIVGRGTKVLIPVPTFFLYEKIVAVLEGEVIAVPARRDLSFDVDAIIAAARREKPALIIVNSPNSPTGQMVSRADVERIIDSTDAIVLLDEAYIEFADAPSMLPLVEQCDRLIVLRTFSKAFSLAGLRIGYLIAQEGLRAELLKPKIPFTVNNFSSSAAVLLLQKKELIFERISFIKTQKQLLYDELCSIAGIKTFPSQTNFLIFQTERDAAPLFGHLLSRNVLIRDVSAYPMLERTLRVNAGTENENRTFITALKKYLNEGAQ